MPQEPTIRLAFTSCASTRLVPNQPIWDDIRASAPDHVVLMGDNIYSDVPDTGVDQLLQMDTDQFAAHLHARYREQLAEPHFRRLVQAPGITLHAIWDDHDFAWNDADGARLLAQPGQAQKIRASTNLMRAFRAALAAKDPDAFPVSASAPVLQADIGNPDFPLLGATSVALEADGRCWLHLTDGRSFRKKPQLLGPAQREQLGQHFATHPHALHIIASGVTFSQGDGWHRYAGDRKWLAQAAGEHGWLMLSGDIHSNGLLEHRLSARGRLIEATASGAAIHAHLNKIIPGPEVRNHGWLEIKPDEVRVRLLSFNRVVTEKPYLRTTGGDLFVA